MSAIVAQRLVSRHRELPEKADRMASADLRKAEMETNRREIVGKAFAEACEPWSLGELSEMLKRDERQIARWKNGAERVQVDVVLLSEALWPRFVVALARLTPRLVEIETVLRVRTA